MRSSPTKFYGTAEFQRLQAEWRKRLKASGFMDLEDDRGVLREDRSSHGDLRVLSTEDSPVRAAYFVLVGRWHHVRVWSSRMQRRLWELHAEGVGIRMATTRMWPYVNNFKSSNERRLYAERAEMFRWLGSEPMLGEGEVERPLTSFEEAMLAEGFDPDGYLVASEGLGV